MDDEASRQGRWQQQAEEALEECGYAYFLPPSDDGVGGDVGGNAVDTDGSGVAHTEQGGQEDKTFPLSTNLGLVVGEKKPGGGQRRPATSKAASRRADLKSRREAAAAEVAERGILEKQSHGLHLEVERATRAASTTFKDGDRVESRWRRPTRLDKPRLDPYAWHTGRVVQSHKDGARVDVVFEDGDGERLSGIPAKYVRLAPLASDLRQPVIGLGAGDGDIATAGSTSLDSPSCPLTAMPIESLCPASRRELAHIASANTSLRRTWEDPVPIGEELARLRMLGEEKRRARPEWQGSFPLLNFQAAKRLSLGAGRAGTAARKAAAAAAAGGRDRRRERRQAQKPHRGGAKARTRKPSAAASLPAKLGIVAAIAEREDEGYRQAHPDFTHALMTGDDTTTTRRGSSSSSPPLSPSSSPALVETQAKLVAAAVAYDRCVVGVRDCLDRGAAAFRVARTYSEQQKAFEESTAALGPALPARAGYTDWRGSAVVGLQNATLDVVEAMDSWAAEWAAARESKIRAEEGGLGRDRGGEGNGAIEGGKEVEKDGVVAAAPVTAPPFLWEGSPLVSTIIGHSAKLLAGAPELKEWYGPGFPMERNPFFLAYPIDDRPVTPRNALVRAWVDGEVRYLVGSFLFSAGYRPLLSLTGKLLVGIHKSKYTRKTVGISASRPRTAVTRTWLKMEKRRHMLLPCKMLAKTQTFFANRTRSWCLLIRLCTNRSVLGPGYVFIPPIIVSVVCSTGPSPPPRLA